MHDSIHVEDMRTHGGGCNKFNQPELAAQIRNAGHPVSLPGYEAFTHRRTLEEYEARLGVLSPREDRSGKTYHPSAHRNISCPLQ